MKRVLVIGATSAIASAAARRWVARGDRVYLAGRSVERLRILGVALETGAGSVAGCHAFEAHAVDGHVALIEAGRAALGSLDVVLVAHGFLGDQQASERDFATADAILRTNLNDTIALLIPLANALDAQGYGTLGVITSVAADRGRPRNYTYAAAKGALNVYLEGLRTRLGPAVRVVTLKVGPTDTPMTAGHRKHPLFASAEQVARGVVAALDGPAGVRYVPRRWRAIMALVRQVPDPIFRRVPFLGGR